MTFSQEWRFEWQNSTFAWKRESSLGTSGPGKNEYSCWAIRSPDPNIWLSIYKPITGGTKRPDESLGLIEAFLQIMDHNISRVDPRIDDRKGFELVMIMTLSSILDQDFDERYREPAENMYLPTMPTSMGTLGAVSSKKPTPVDSHLLMGRKRPLGASSDGTQAEQNEVFVEAWGEVSEYVDYCMRLLRDGDGGENLSIILLKTSTAANSQKAVAVAANVKAAFYKLPDKFKGKGAGEELFQYVRAETQEQQQPEKPAPIRLDPDKPGGRPIIKLGAPPPAPPSPPPAPKPAPKPRPSSSNYTPPSSLTIYLSKERISELEPNSKPGPRIPPKHASPSPAAPGTSVSPGGSPRPSSRPPLKDTESSDSSSGLKGKLFHKLGIK